MGSVCKRVKVNRVSYKETDKSSPCEQAEVSSVVSAKTQRTFGQYEA